LVKLKIVSGNIYFYCSSYEFSIALYNSIELKDNPTDFVLVKFMLFLSYLNKVTVRTCVDK